MFSWTLTDSIIAGLAIGFIICWLLSKLPDYFD